MLSLDVSVRLDHLVGPRAFMLTLLSSARGQMCFYGRGWFADEIVQFTGYGGELMRDAIRNDDHLAFAYLVFLASLDFSAPNLVRRDLLRIDRLATGDQRGRPIDDINDISIQRVDLGLTGFNAPAGMHFVTTGFEQRLALGKGSSDPACVDKCCTCSRGR